MKENLFEKLKEIEKEHHSFFSKHQSKLINYISVATSPNGEVLYKSKLVISKNLPKEIAEKVQSLLS
jgi:hypothetical protein